MATEQSGLLTYKDANGTLHILYPATLGENVILADGSDLEEAIAKKAPLLNPTFTQNVNITGNLLLKGSGNYGNKINFGDGDYVHIAEIADDRMEIKATHIQMMNGSTKVAELTGNKMLYGGAEVANKTDVDKKANLWVAETTGTNAFQYKVTLDPAPRELYVGMQLVIIPHATCTATSSASLNVNNLGAKLIRFRGETSGTLYAAQESGFLTEGKPVQLIYDGTYWVINDSNVDSGKITFKNYTNCKRTGSAPLNANYAAGANLREGGSPHFRDATIFSCGNSRFSDIYFDNFMHTTCAGPEVYRTSAAAAGIYGHGAIFAGGCIQSISFTGSSAVDYYTIKFTRTTPTELSVPMYQPKSAMCGSYYAFFAGPQYNAASSVVNMYPNSLTRNVTNLSGAAVHAAGAPCGGTYAIFAFTENDTTVTVNAFNSSMVRSTLSTFSKYSTSFVGAGVRGYAIFGGGSPNIYEVYDSSLVKVTVSGNAISMNDFYGGAGVSLQDYAIFFGGGDSSALHVIDQNLLHTTPAILKNQGRIYCNNPARLNSSSLAFINSRGEYNTDYYESSEIKLSGSVDIPAYHAYKFNSDTSERTTYNNIQVRYSYPINGYIRPLKVVSDD